MLLAVIITLLKLQSEGIIGWELIVGGLAIGSLIGYLMATRVEMTGMPELVALFNGFGGDLAGGDGDVGSEQSWDDNHTSLRGECID